MDAGLLILRVASGLLMAAHGGQKLFGWFGGYGLAAVSGFFEALGLRPGRVFAPLVVVSELASGLLVALGFLGPIGPALMLPVMIVAAITVHWQNGLFAATNGVELNFLYAAIAIALALIGPGRYSLDAQAGLNALWTPTFAWGALAVGTAGAAASLAVRRAVVGATVAA